MTRKSKALLEHSDSELFRKQKRAFDRKFEKLLSERDELRALNARLYGYLENSEVNGRELLKEIEKAKQTIGELRERLDAHSQ